MSIFSAYGSDTEKEEQGVWFTGRGGIQVLLARRSSLRSQRALEEARAPYREMFDAFTRGDRDAIPDHISAKVNAQWIARGILLAWRGPNGEDHWLGENGQELRFSPETAQFLLEDRRLHELRAWILDRSDEIDAYRLKSEEEAEKNSSPGMGSSETTTKPKGRSSSGLEPAAGASAH
jgi:hypothetical protein